MPFCQNQTMINFTNQLSEQVNYALDEASRQPGTSLAYAERAVGIIIPYINQLRNFILTYRFKDPEEEITLFKNIVPEFISLLIYHQKLFHIEMRRPAASISIQQKLLQREYKKIGYFFSSNMELLAYYNAGIADKDRTLFMRGGQDILLTPDDYALLFDPQFCPVASYKIAKMKAYGRLQEYLLNALSTLKKTRDTRSSQLHRKSNLQWTDSKVAATELGYGLFANKSFNNGKADLKDIFEGLESFLNIKLGLYHSTYQDIKRRKKERTPYIRQTMENLEQKMDRDDEDN